MGSRAPTFSETARRGGMTSLTLLIMPTGKPEIRLSSSLKDAKPIVFANADRFASSFGAALYWMVRHYWKRPENRAELTDGRALERLHNEQFDSE